MTIEAERDIIGLIKAGRVVGLVLRAMQENLQPGITTKALDTIGDRIMREHGARSAPRITYKFPGATCISVNDEATHGIPGERVIRDGDIVKLDVSLELDGYFADTNVTIPVGNISPKEQKLIDCARAAMEAGIAAAKAGRPINVIGRAAEQTVNRCGFNVLRDLTGHGIGRALHESPTVPHYYHKRANSRLEPGMVITVEPHISMGKSGVVTDKDGWTIRTRDGSSVASFEHTVVITDDQPILITAL
jgi:methionyl aminopeptidase